MWTTQVGLIKRCAVNVKENKLPDKYENRYRNRRNVIKLAGVGLGALAVLGPRDAQAGPTARLTIDRIECISTSYGAGTDSEDQLYIRVQDASRQLSYSDIWYNRGGRDISSGESLAVNFSKDIDLGLGVYIELFDHDHSSGDDSLGSIVIQNVSFPYSETLTVETSEERSKYLVTVRIDSL